MDFARRLVRFVEPSTKLASQIPFFIGVAYSLHLAGSINLKDTAILWAAVWMFDLPVTMINNHLDKRRAKEEPHFGRAASLSMIVSAIAVSLSLGLVLSAKYGLCFLAAGALCFAAGILYSATPISISRTPYGEIVSGLVQGLAIIYLVVFVNLPPGYLASASIKGASFSLEADIWSTARLVLVALPAVFCISNIMLANNLCDIQRDVLADRRTLPYYIGKDASILLFRLLYALAYLSVAAASLTGTLTLASLLTFATIPLAWRNVQAFAKEQAKAKTFINSIKNFALILVPYTATIFAGALL
jgi:1,4-dihydroxy-2-naphthoate octaprenyltransferase